MCVSLRSRSTVGLSSYGRILHVGCGCVGAKWLSRVDGGDFEFGGVDVRPLWFYEAV
jgi:hypothetical protein